MNFFGVRSFIEKRIETSRVIGPVSYFKRIPISRTVALAVPTPKEFHSAAQGRERM